MNSLDSGRTLLHPEKVSDTATSPEEETRAEPAPGDLRAVIITPAAAQEEDKSYIIELVSPGDYLIAADGGADVALALGLLPDLVVGDLDSIDPETLERLRILCPVRSFPVRKDKTDTHLAIEAATGAGANEVVVCGAFGDRHDHNLGLVLLLAGLPPFPPVRLVGSRYEAFLAGPYSLFCGSPGDAISLLPLSPVVIGVSTEGLSYPLDGAALTWGETLGVSNEMVGGEASVSVAGEGRLLVVHTKGAW